MSTHEERVKARREKLAASGHAGRLLTTAEAADYLNVSVASVQRLRASGHLAIVKVGHSVRYEPGELERYIKRNRHEATRF